MFNENFEDVYINEGVVITDELLTSISFLKNDKNVLFVYDAPVLNLTRVQPIDKVFFNTCIEHFEKESILRKFNGLFNSLFNINAKAIIIESIHAHNTEVKRQEKILKKINKLGLKISLTKNGSLISHN
jgi:hypothetical protein